MIVMFGERSPTPGRFVESLSIRRVASGRWRGCNNNKGQERRILRLCCFGERTNRFQMKSHRNSIEFSGFIEFTSIVPKQCTRSVHTNGNTITTVLALESGCPLAAADRLLSNYVQKSTRMSLGERAAK